jgi:riboflavin-specific deaminase-like protein
MAKAAAEDARNALRGGDTAPWAWQASLDASRIARSEPPEQACAYGVAPDGGLRTASEDREAVLRWLPDGGWHVGPACPVGARDLFELYLPICSVASGTAFTVGHLGQSLDACIATRTGDSCHVTGRENILHLHRMRALSDAIIVGAETVAADDPQLTTRLVPGDNPVRVVLDPSRRLEPSFKVFNDGDAETLLVWGKGGGGPTRHGQAEIIRVREEGGRLDLADLLEKLLGCGLGIRFIEGGGVTVSSFLRAGLLDRLQVAVSPVIIGNGRAGLQLPPSKAMGDCLRLRHRLYRMGEDILFDCDPTYAGSHDAERQEPTGIERVL